MEVMSSAIQRRKDSAHSLLLDDGVLARGRPPGIDVENAPDCRPHAWTVEASSLREAQVVARARRRKKPARRRLAETGSLGRENLVGCSHPRELLDDGLRSALGQESGESKFQHGATL